jgi:protein-tyrosine phosphatase
MKNGCVADFPERGLRLSSARKALARAGEVVAARTGRWALPGRRANAAAPHRAHSMDMTWVTGRIAVGGGIWTSENMAEVARARITHILDMQIEFDDTPLAEPHGIKVLWNPTDDDFQSKPPELFEAGVDFALQALDENGSRLFIHCAAGVHRAPMMALAVLCSLNWNLGEAMQLIESKRVVADFPDVYVNSVKRYLQQQVKASR